MSDRDKPECAGPVKRRDIAERIRRVGWTTLGIFGGPESPPFGYTIGLTEKGMPEFVLLGAPIEHVQNMVNAVVERALKGEAFEGAFLDEILANDLRVAIVRAPKARANSEFLVQAEHYYGREVEVLQIVLPDRKGLFPWDDGYDERFRAAQEAIGPLREPPVPEDQQPRPPGMSLH